MTNHLKVLIFFGVIATITTALGVLLFGNSGLPIGLAVGVAIVVSLVGLSDWLVLKIHRAQILRSAESMGVHDIIERLAERARISVPQIYLSPSHSLSAFSVGRGPHHASIVVTEGLLAILSYDELEGVLAHEVAHIKNRDTFVGTIAAVVAIGCLACAKLSSWGAILGKQRTSSRQPGALDTLLGMIFVPLAGVVLQTLVARSKDFEADRAGAEFCMQPEWMANALRKIQNMSTGHATFGTPGAAHLYTVNPYSSSALLGVLDRHAPVELRVQKLLALKYGKYRSIQSGVQL